MTHQGPDAQDGMGTIWQEVSHVGVGITLE